MSQAFLELIAFQPYRASTRESIPWPFLGVDRCSAPELSEYKARGAQRRHNHQSLVA